MLSLSFVNNFFTFINNFILFFHKYLFFINTDFDFPLINTAYRVISKDAKGTGMWEKSASGVD